MKKRNVLLTAANKDFVRLRDVELPGDRVLMPPFYVMFRGKLYENKGTGLGGETPTNFYREVEREFFVLEG